MQDDGAKVGLETGGAAGRPRPPLGLRGLEALGMGAVLWGLAMGPLSWSLAGIAAIGATHVLYRRLHPGGRAGQAPGGDDGAGGE